METKNSVYLVQRWLIVFFPYKCKAHLICAAPKKASSVMNRINLIKLIGMDTSLVEISVHREKVGRVDCSPAENASDICP